MCWHRCGLPVFRGDAFRSPRSCMPKLFGLVCRSNKSSCENWRLWTDARCVQKWLLSQRWWRFDASALDVTGEFGVRRVHIAIRRVGVWCAMLGDNDVRAATISSQKQCRSFGICARWRSLEPTGKLPGTIVSVQWVRRWSVQVLILS